MGDGYSAMGLTVFNQNKYPRGEVIVSSNAVKIRARPATPVPTARAVPDRDCIKLKRMMRG
jgi:hypothetical protein